MATRHKLRQLVSAGEVTEGEATLFYQMMEAYMVAVTQYLLVTLPIDDDHLKKVQWFSPDKFVGRCDDMLHCAMR